MGEMESNILEFDLKELEEDLLGFDLDAPDSLPLGFDLDETDGLSLRFDLDEADNLSTGFDLDETDGLPLEYDLDDMAIERLELIGSETSVSEPKKPGCPSIPAWRRRAAIACACLAGVGALMTTWMTVRVFAEEYGAEQKMEDLRRYQQHALLPEREQDKAPEIVPEIVPEELQENPYADAFSKNEDMAAWLYVEDTQIDYPVMLTMEDEEYYLQRDFYGNTDRAGCLLFDTDSPLYGGQLTTNLIIHGHNMRIGTMFGDLDLYRDEEYGREHSRIELYTETELRSYEVIAVFYSQVYYAADPVFKYYNFFCADTEEEFLYFYDNIKTLSLYDTGVEAELGDHFLTLSTCAYQTEDGRFVVVAKETDRGPNYIKKN